MSFLYSILIVYFIILILFQIFLIVVFLGVQRKQYNHSNNEPKISILLAVRNEERNILSCLMAINNLEYPKDKMEVLIGDDLSEDRTQQIIKDYIADKPQFRLFKITQKVGLAGAKGNVLAQIAREAKGDYFFITDADVRVPGSWIYGLLAACTDGIAIVSGAALVEGKGVFAKLQAIDWITAFGMIYAAVESDIPITAVGNNMMIRREAYFATGGFENIPFSVTEDLDLHEAVRNLGWKNKNMLNHEILSFTNPIIGINNLLQQRRRWMTGAVRLHKGLVFILGIQSAFFLFLIISLFYMPLPTIGIWAAKILFQNIFVFFVLKKIKQPVALLRYCLWYELYAGVCSIALLIYYFLPIKTVWKGRKYA